MLRAIIPVAVVVMLGPLRAAGEPMDLLDLRSRPVYVAFEISPSDRPDQLDTMYSEPYVAWFEPAGLDGRIRVTLDASAVERMMREHQPKSGTFSDFVWEFDTESGHVVSAALTGTLVTDLDWGLFTTEVETDIEVVMATHQRGGFLRPRERLGNTVFTFCSGSGPDCTPVSPRTYDRATGYVNAVGEILARSVSGIAARTFSPLGEAIFSEMELEMGVLSQTH